MKLFCHIAFLCMGIQAFHAQKLVLPIVKSGNWYLVEGIKEQKLPEKYTYVSLFDENGTAFFNEGNQYGIIDQEGKIILEANYTDISSLGFGYFKCRNASGLELISIKNRTSRSLPCISAEQIQTNWLVYRTGQGSFLLNTPGEKTIPFDDSLQTYENLYNCLYLHADSSKNILYSEKGEKLFEGNALILRPENYIRFISKDLNILIDYFGSWFFPPKTSFITVGAKLIQYQQNGIAYLVDRESKIPLISYPCDQIEKYEKGNYLIHVGQNIGIISGEKKVILKPEYDYISRYNDFIYLSKNRLIGLCDTFYRPVLPCSYAGISIDRQFFHTSSVNEGDGLISRITKTEILPPNYDKILLENGLVKAWYQDKLTIFELTKEHQIKNKVILANAISLRKRSPAYKPGQTYKIDPRLFPLGWFYDTISMTDPKTKLWTATSYKWGLKTVNDSILIKARLKQPVFLPLAPVSLIRAGAMKESTFQKYDREIECYQIADFSRGKIHQQYQLFSIDTTDFMKHDYARFSHSGGFGVIKGDGKIDQLSYIDHSDEEFVRFCVAENVELDETSNDENFPLPDYQFNFNWQYGLFYHDQKGIQVKGIWYKSLKPTNPAWNFYTQSGDSLFPESFEYARKFYKETAIVKRKTGWGVIHGDSIVIPLIYSKIERIPQYHDSVFLVCLKQSGKLFLDTNMLIKKTVPDILEKQLGSLYLYRHGDEKYVLDQNGKEISKRCSNIKLHAFDRYVVKEKKMYVIYNENGSGIGEVKHKPETFLDEEHFTAEEKGKLGLISTFEDTVIPFEYKEIEQIGPYFLAKNTGIFALYDRDFKLLKKTTEGRIIVDSISNLWALQKNDKVELFDEKGEKKGGLKSEQVLEYFFNSCLLTAKGNVILPVKMEQKIIPPRKAVDIRFYPNAYCAIQEEDHSWILYDPSWEKIGDTSLYKRKLTYHGDDVFSCSSKQDFLVIDAKNNEVLTNFSGMKGNWSNGTLVAKTSDKKSPYHFVDRDFKDPFHHSFKCASEFKSGFAAVCDERGWTLINSRGIQQSYPSFPEITNHGNLIFETSKKPLYGIIDSEGKTILEPVFEKITFVQNQLIQVIKEGKIGYFDLNGKKLYYESAE